MSQDHKQPHPSNPPADKRNEPPRSDDAIIDGADISDAPESEGRATRGTGRDDDSKAKTQTPKTQGGDPGACCT